MSLTTNRLSHIINSRAKLPRLTWMPSSDNSWW